MTAELKAMVDKLEELLEKEKARTKELADQLDAALLAVKMEDSEQMTLRRASQIEVENRDLQADNERLRRKVTRLEGEMKKASNELGVPQPGYPAPVANASEILNTALKEVCEDQSCSYECTVCSHKSCVHVDILIRDYEEANDRQLETIAQWELDANNWPTMAEFSNIQEAYEDAEKNNAHLEERHQDHLALIRRLSMESISPEEAVEMKGQIATLISEVGTLKSKFAKFEKC